jgi:hypothetical protein
MMKLDVSKANKAIAKGSLWRRKSDGALACVKYIAYGFECWSGPMGLDESFEKVQFQLEGRNGVWQLSELSFTRQYEAVKETNEDS